MDAKRIGGWKLGGWEDRKMIARRIGAWKLGYKGGS